LGALGGMIAEACLIAQRIVTWQGKRNAARTAGRDLPPSTRFVAP
jgi:hypothetical protein